MAGKPGRSGRKKVVSTLMNEAMERVDEYIPELFNKLIEKGLQGDREALIYLIDRRMGKPKQQTDLDLKGGGEIGTKLMVKLLAAIARGALEEGEEFELLEIGKKPT